MVSALLSTYRKYFNLNENMQLSSRVSPMVWGISNTKFIILMGALWNIGDGRYVKFWNDPGFL